MDIAFCDAKADAEIRYTCWVLAQERRNNTLSQENTHTEKQLTRQNDPQSAERQRAREPIVAD